MVSLNTLAGLVGGMEGYQQYQKDQQKRQMEQIDLLDRQARLRLDQQKADAEQAAMLRSQNADKNAAAVLQGIYGGTNPSAQPPVPPPSSPPQQMAPGQPSVPMQQANQQRPPIPPQGVQGQMPPAGTPPLPQGQPGQAPARPQPQQQAQPAPYQRIDTQVQQRQQAQQAQAAQQQATDLANSPTPPEENSLTFQGAVKVLQSKGITGPAMIDALDRLTPYLNQEAKQQAQALKDQLAIQKSALDAARLELQGKHDAALEANANARLSVEAQRVRIEASRAASEASIRTQAGWTVMQDKDGNLVRVNSRTGEVAKMQGTADLGLTKPGIGKGAQLDKDTIDQMADQYLAGDKSIFTNLGRGAQGANNVVAVREAVAKKVKEQGLNPTDVLAAFNRQAAAQAAERTAGSQAAKINIATQAASNAIDLVRQTSAAVPRTQFVPANKALEAARTNTGNPKTVAFGAALNTFVNEYAAAVGRGSPRISDKEHAREMLNTAQTAQQVNAVLDVLQGEMDRAQSAARSVVNSQSGAVNTGIGKGSVPALVKFGDLK